MKLYLFLEIPPYSVYVHRIHFIYLLLEKGKGREKERERNINVWLPLTCPQPGTRLEIQACAMTGIQTATLWFTGQHSVHRAPLARAVCIHII